MGKWCPRCGAEYVEGWGTCSECGVALVAEPPPEPEPRGVAAETSLVEPRALDEDDDPFVAIWEGPTPEGVALSGRLEAALIPVDLGEAAEPGRLRIEVPRSYVGEALGVLDREGVAAEAPTPSDEDEWAPEPQAALRWTRTALWIGALVLIVVLILTSR